MVIIDTRETNVNRTWSLQIVRHRLVRVGHDTHVQ